MDLSHPAADLLGESQARILHRLAVVSDGLTGRRIGELAGVPVSTTQRILADLERIGLVTARTAGAARVYTLNRRHVLWDPVERMFAAPARIEQIISESASEIVGDRASVALYGSAARGEADRESDADIVIVWKDDIDSTDREAVLATMSERVAEATGNRVEIVDLTRDDLRRLTNAKDPLVESWKVDAKTVVGLDLKRLIRLTLA
ncbi:nucleotidyltransferase domain-containing protein [Agromyces sp. Soil535]|uniref:nucleotidyltransferase domain-containing protein n=1 Tax=Agromyces sp. Soil535 TaxID=1736390 RepID=UPI0006FFB902|nr:nucleotidyltransferase domain-containing protein [Agromyces sp. Soil535]